MAFKPGALKTPLPYYGGKQEMVNDILPLIPDHHVYVEPFCGGASVFFKKPLVPINVLNDLNGHVVNFWRVMQTDFLALNKMIRATPHSRELADYSKLILGSGSEPTPVQRAWALFYSVVTGFSNTIDGGFPVAKTADRNSKMLQLKSKRKFFAAAKFLIDQATVEKLDAIECILKYDSDKVWFYVDPPYLNANQGHYAGWMENDLGRLLTTLNHIEGKFMLSEFPNPMIMEWAQRSGWRIKEFTKVARASTIMKGKPRADKIELLIMNYDAQGNRLPCLWPDYQAYGQKRLAL